MYRINDVQFYSLNLIYYCHYSVPRCFFTGLPRRTKDLKLPVHTEGSQTDINEKVNTFGQKRKIHKVQYITHIHEPYNGAVPYVKDNNYFARKRSFHGSMRNQEGWLNRFDDLKHGQFNLMQNPNR